MADDLYKLSWQQFRENITANFRCLYFRCLVPTWIVQARIFYFNFRPPISHSPMIYMLIPRELRDTSELHDVSLYIDDNQHSIGAHKVFD